ncbi:hypothetical protein HYG86_04910 [Alkalicella caledoniensis]|uniref:Uncharacterized protein n=1 Tax=Alkalicella caledoniensis TaxID=2731377 RepID=A0A7G9W644_ALKCA|nr:hypothetical protein [Alkalicella caledoniensis]QNO14156.1 hypothetical protein HYG86_04910 [Alkalicella caledoniensis]
MFLSEAALVNFSLPLLIEEFENGNANVNYIMEPKGLFGIPDIVIYNGKVVSIEYKLKNWKQAIKQAYRYQSFSCETYVVLDMDHVKSAKKNIDIFKKFNIGLGAVDNEKIEFFYKPSEREPFNEIMSKKVLELFM